MRFAPVLSVIAVGAAVCPDPGTAQAREVALGHLAAIETTTRIGPPLLEIGGDPLGDDIFVEIADGTFLQDGSFVVSDNQLFSVRRYSPDGEPIWSVGREGDGPGDFRKPETLFDVADSVFVFDRATQRLTVLGWGGDVERSVRIRGSFASSQSLGRFPKGQFFARSANRNAGGMPGEMTRDTVQFVLVDEDLEWTEPLTRVPGTYTSVVRVGGQRAFRTSPFTPVPAHAVLGECLLVTSSEAQRLSLLRPDGTVVAELSGSSAPRPVDQAALEAWDQFYLDLIPPEQHMVFKDMSKELPKPAHLPAFSEVLVDDQGRIWLQDYEVPFGFQSHGWTVLGPDGVPLSRVHSDLPMSILDVRGDRVLARRIVEHEVEVVSVHEVRLPARSVGRPLC